MAAHPVDRARLFHQLHAGAVPLVLPNAWDAVSARIIEQAGAAAIATTSAGMAWSLGYRDGERMPVAEMLAACARICRVVQAPVSVDIERGYGRDAGAVADTVAALLDLGIAGVNIEDGVDGDGAVLVDDAVLCDRIAAIRTVADRAGVPLFVNARTDTYFVSGRAPQERREETLRRAERYSDAGADGIFVPGITDLADIAQIAASIPRPLNVYAGFPGVPPIGALQRAGVRRVSLGCGPLQSALARLKHIAGEAVLAGTYAAMADDMLSGAECNGLFAIG